MSPTEKKAQHTASDVAPAAGAAQPTTDSADEKTPAEIRSEIAVTREELGDTVEALAAKTDVKAQAKAKVDEVKSQAQAKVDEVKSIAQAAAEEAKAKAKEAAPESPQDAGTQAQTFAKENPKPLAIAGAVLVLLVLWRLLRS